MITISFESLFEELRALVAAANAAALPTARVDEKAGTIEEIPWQEDLDRLIASLHFRSDARSLATRLSGWCYGEAGDDTFSFYFQLPIGRFVNELTEALRTWLLNRLFLHKLTPDSPWREKLEKLLIENMQLITDLLYTLEYA